MTRKHIKKTLVLLFTLSLSVALSTAWANAPDGVLTFTPSPEQPSTLQVNGVFPRDGAKQLAEALDKYPNTRRINLHSIGGSYLAGMAMGHVIRQRAVDTAVGEGMTCQSACVYVLAGGVKRKIDKKAFVGVHSHGDNNWGQHFNMTPNSDGSYQLNNNGIAYIVGNSLLMVREGGMHLRQMGVGAEVLELILTTPSHGGRMCIVAHPCTVRWGLDNQSKLTRSEASHTCGLGESLMTEEGLKTQFFNGRYLGQFPQACTEYSY